MKFKKLIPALCMLLVAAVLMGTSTFAWFSMNTSVQATGLQIQAKSNAIFLLIGEDTLTTADQIQGQTGADLTSEDLAVAATDSDVYPSKAFGVANADKDPATTTTFDPTAVTTKALAASEDNWYTANSNDSSVWGGDGITINPAQLTSTNFSDYVIKKTVNLTLADGSENAHNLTVTPTITLRDDVYNKTSDSAIVSGKKYYTKSGSTYTEVASPAVADIATYYEVGTDISAVKVLIVSDNNVVAILSTASSETDLYSGTTTQNIVLTDKTVHSVDIYVYYDGTEAAVYSNNAAALGGATITLQFDVELAE